MDPNPRLAGVATVAAGALALAGCGAHAARTAPDPPARHPATADGRLPLSFVHDRRARYVAHSPGGALLFTRRAVTLAATRGPSVRLRFAGADPHAVLSGADPDGGTLNLLVGDRSRWRRHLPTYRALTYRGLWPGIDLVLRGGGGTLKYELHVRPHARLDAVRLAYSGARRLRLARDGSLRVDTVLGRLTDARPVAYQLRGGSRVVVPSRFVVGAKAYGFALGAGYDPARPLVVDPGLAYGALLGGSDADEGLGIAVDPAGSAYVTGRTLSADYPGASAGARGSDVFVTKLDASRVAYSTVIGGLDADEGLGIAVDRAGSAYVTGQTRSGDFPTTDGGPGGGAGDAFVTKLSPDGSALLYSTLLGGGARDAGLGVALRGGAAYVTGFTASPDFPTTAGAFAPALAGATDAFVARLAPDGSGVAYATFLGGADADAGFGIAVDRSGAAYLTGRTASADYPVTAGAFDATPAGSFDAFVTKLAPDGSQAAYSTLLGGAMLDGGSAVAVDRDGTAYVTGVTYSQDYPTTPGAADPSFDGGADAFVTALRGDGSAPRYSTFMGGGGRDEGAGIAVDRQRRARITGQTWSPDFPATADAVDPSFNGVADAFVAELAPGGWALTSATFLGGGDYDAGTAIATGPEGTPVYVTGSTLSGDFPAPRQGPGGRRDAFVAALRPSAAADE